MKVKATFLVLSLAGVSGCTVVVDPHAGFRDVEEAVRSRIGKRVVWNQGSAADEEVARLVTTKLRGGRLTAEDAVEVSLLNNPGLHAEYEELGVSQAELVRAGLLANPTLSAERRFRGRAAEIDVAQSFLGLFLLPLRTKVAAAEYDAVKLRLAQRVLDHAAEVKTAFYTLQGDLQLLEMRRTVVAASEASYGAANALRKAGNTSALDLSNEAALLTRARLDLSEAEARVVEGRERLNVLLGAWGEGTRWAVDERLPGLPDHEVTGAARLERHALRNRLDVQAARRALDGAASSVGLARYEALFPDLSVGAHFEREPEGSETVGPSLDLPLPLFDWGRAAASGQEALLRQGLGYYAALAIEVRSEVRAAYGRMRAARDRAAYFSGTVLPLQARVLEQTQLLYNGMFLGVFQLLQAKQAQIEAGRDYIRTLQEYWLARTALERSIGGSLAGVLAPAEGAAPALPEPPPPAAAPTGGSAGPHQHDHRHHGG